MELRPRGRPGQPVVHTDDRDEIGGKDELPRAHDQHPVLHLLQVRVDILQRVAGRQVAEGKLRTGHAAHKRDSLQHVHGVRERSLFVGRSSSPGTEHGRNWWNTRQAPETAAQGKQHFDQRLQAGWVIRLQPRGVGAD